MKIPGNLKSKITKKDISTLILEIEPSQDPIGNSIKEHDFFRHAERIRKKLKEELEIKSIKLHNEVIQKQTELQKQLNKKYDETNSIMKKQSNLQKRATTNQEKSNAIMKKQNWIIFGQIIVTLFLIWATLHIGDKSNDIAETQVNISRLQAEIQQHSSAPYEPKLKIQSDFSSKLSARDLLKEHGQRKRVKICIKNIGITSARNIRINWKNNWTLWTCNYRNIHIRPGIEPGETNCSWLELPAYKCFNDSDDCKKEILAEDGLELNAYIKCDNCIPKEYNKNFSVCIWENSSAECEEN